MKLYELDQMIKDVCPIDGISSDGTVWFRSEATDEQKAAAETLMATSLPDLEADAL